MRIRPGEAGDLDALCALEAAAFPGDRLERRQFRHALRSPSIVSRVAAEGERVRGYGLVETRRGARIAHVTSLAVDPAAAGQGLGRRLLAALETEATVRGVGVLRLEMREDNRAARALYQGAGYERTGIEPDYYEDGAAAWRYEKSLP